MHSMNEVIHSHKLLNRVYKLLNGRQDLLICTQISFVFFPPWPPQPAPPPSPQKKWIVRVVYSIFNCFSFTPKTRPWALMIRFDWCLRPASCASTMPHRVWNRVRLANRSWGGLWCQWREAFCVEMMYSAEGAKPPAAHFQPRGGLHPPHDPYSPPRAHKHKRL